MTGASGPDGPAPVLGPGPARDASLDQQSSGRGRGRDARRSVLRERLHVLGRRQLPDAQTLVEAARRRRRAGFVFEESQAKRRPELFRRGRALHEAESESERRRRGVVVVGEPRFRRRGGPPLAQVPGGQR